ncbi:hypothetical protein WBG78_28435 [Chryseolinea sp. T2]|uniref:hypothetical protein n=1 Tax=Chryseolinea sp. T2 TaxID=3129255 RepID=UPI003077C192
MDLRTAIQKLAKQDVFESVLGTVKAVDTSTKTCTVTPLEDSPDLLEVRLSAEQSPINGPIPIPAVGSWVIVGNTANDQPHIVMFSQLDSYTLIFGNTEYKLSEQGLKLTVDSDDLKTGMQDLKSALMAMTVNTPVGTSSIPCNVADIEAALNKIIATLD